MPHKRIDVAIRAFNALRRPLVVVGNGPDARRLRRLAGPTDPLHRAASATPRPRPCSRARAGARRDRDRGVRDRRRRGPGRRAPGDRAGRRRRARDRARGRDRHVLRAARPGRAGRGRARASTRSRSTRRVRRANAARFDVAHFRHGLRAVVDADAREPRRAAPPTPVAAPPGRPGVAAVAPAAAPRPPTAGFQALLLAAAAALSGFTILRGYGPHDEGLMLAWAGADGRRAVALPRLLVELRARARRCCSPALTKAVRPVAAGVARAARRGRRAHRAGRLPPRAARRGRAGWALAAWVAVAGAMAFPTGPGPNAAGAAARARRRCSPPAARRPAAGCSRAGVRVPPRARARGARWRVALEAALGAPARARSRSSRRCCSRRSRSSRAATWPARSLGFARRCRACSGCRSSRAATCGADPNKLLELLLPAAPRRRRGAWAAWALWRRPRARALGARAAARRRSRLPARAAPTSSTCCRSRSALAVALALAAAAERATAPRGVLAVVLARDRRPRPRAPRRRRSLTRRALAPVPGGGRGRRAGPTRPTRARCGGCCAFVARRVPPGRPVLVAPPRFDRVRVGDPLLGVLLGGRTRRATTSCSPAWSRPPTVQREMARDLDRRRTPVVDPLAGAGRARDRAERVGAVVGRAASSTARSPPATGARRGTATTSVLVRRRA